MPVALLRLPPLPRGTSPAQLRHPAGQWEPEPAERVLLQPVAVSLLVRSPEHAGDVPDLLRDLPGDGPDADLRRAAAEAPRYATLHGQLGAGVYQRVPAADPHGAVRDERGGEREVGHYGGYFRYFQ